MFRPVKQPRISEEVLNQLKESILIGALKPGDKLPSERQLAETFQVSRLAVREAIRALETAGFVVTRCGAAGGVYVTDPTFENLSRPFLDHFMANKISISEIHLVRVFIDPEVARLAALNVTPEYAQRLKDAFEAEDPPGVPDSEVIARGAKVHYILAEMCGNRFLEAIVNLILAVSKKVMEMVKPERPVVHQPGAHRPIIEAVIAGDPEAAAAAMLKHAIDVGDSLIRIGKIYQRQIDPTK